MLSKLSAGTKSSELAVVIVVSALASWLISRGATVDTVLAMSATGMTYIGGRSHVKAAEMKAKK